MRLPIGLFFGKAITEEENPKGKLPPAFLLLHLMSDFRVLSHRRLMEEEAAVKGVQMGDNVGVGSLGDVSSL